MSPKPRVMKRARAKGAKLLAGCALASLAVRGARGDATHTGTTRLGVDDARGSDEAPRESGRARRARAGIASLGYGLSDVQPNLNDDTLPHGKPGWRWRFGSREGLSFVCPDSNAHPNADPNANLGEGDEDSYLDETDNALPDPPPTRYVVRYGTYGRFADTGVDKYNDAWFESVEHQADIKWTYGVCRPGQTIKCESSTFGYVNPFPSIADGMPGKKCQYLNVRDIPSRDVNASISFAPGEQRMDVDSLGAEVDLNVINTNNRWGVRSFYVFSAGKVKAMLKEMFPDTVMHQDFVWHWCANEGSDYPSSGCECNTMMRYGWTGNQTLQAPNPAEDPDFSKWTIVDARFEDTPVIPCNHHKLGGVLPFPLANERICQCLDSTTLALFNAGLQATIGGPDVPGQTLFNMTNHTHYYNKTHVDYVREQHRAAAAAANASDHPADDDAEKRHESDLGRRPTPVERHRAKIAELSASRTDVDSILTASGATLVVASVAVFAVVVFARYRRLREYQRVPETIETDIDF